MPRSPAHEYHSSGSYEVNLTVFSDSGNCQHTYFNYLFVDVIDSNTVCKANFSFNINKDTVQFFNSSIGSFTHANWNFGDAGYSTLNDPVHVYASPGFYYVSLNIMDSLGGCNDYFSKEIQVMGEPGCNFDSLMYNIYPETGPGMYNGGIDINPTGGIPPYSFSWSNGSFNEDVFGLASGNYGVTITDYNGCTLQKTFCGAMANCDVHPSFAYSTQFNDTATTIVFENNSIGPVFFC
ncbi:MAG: hypothetical protein HC896_18030 [Bacteroidales bacterium]|nr:hypothetical protein [Bacteroidales bacterium]